MRGFLQLFLQLLVCKAVEWERQRGPQQPAPRQPVTALHPASDAASYTFTLSPSRPDCPGTSSNRSSFPRTASRSGSPPLSATARSGKR